jgi:hypothetical protein
VASGLHDVERDASNRVEADQAQLKRRLHPMRGIKTLTGRRIFVAAYAFEPLPLLGVLGCWAPSSWYPRGPSAMVKIPLTAG